MGVLKILVCTHNKRVEIEDPQLFPIQVGKDASGIDLGITADNTGDNISIKNPNYCELTGLYWAWKNLKDYDYIGLCHYRRYFNFSPSLFEKKAMYVIDHNDLVNHNITCSNIDSVMKKYDIILATPTSLPTSLTYEYAYKHSSHDYIILKNVVHDLYPEYSNTFNLVMELNNSASYYNMFISTKEFNDNYCLWLFNILREVEQRTDISNYDQQQARIYGYMSERLFNVYIRHHNLKIKYLPVVFTGDTPKQTTVKHLVKNTINNLSFFFGCKLQNYLKTKESK